MGIITWLKRRRLSRLALLDEEDIKEELRAHLAIAAEAISDGAQEMVWMVEKGEEIHPVLSAAVEESDEVVIKIRGLVNAT